MEYEKHADTRNATFELNGDKYLEYISHYVSPQKRKRVVCVKQRKTLARILKRRCIREYSPHVCYMDMLDTASFISECGFTKSEMPFIQQYYRSLYSFIHTSDFKEHKLYFYEQQESGDDEKDVVFAHRNAFIKNKATN